jgi:hypothetical protein
MNEDGGPVRQRRKAALSNITAEMQPAFKQSPLRLPPSPLAPGYPRFVGALPLTNQLPVHPPQPPRILSDERAARAPHGHIRRHHADALAGAMTRFREGRSAGGYSALHSRPHFRNTICFLLKFTFLNLIEAFERVGRSAAFGFGDGTHCVIMTCDYLASEWRGRIAPLATLLSII